MKDLNRIGINENKAEILALKLNDLLANYSVMYQNIRSYHWNIKGDKFFELHIKFEELYNNLLEKIDEIAERVLTLAHTPMHKFSDYLTKSEIKESHEVEDKDVILNDILASFKTLIIKQREILAVSDEADDEGTNALMSDYIREQEKLVWMFSAYLNK
jgi:starvation-inducible DNA-binding protein